MNVLELIIATIVVILYQCLRIPVTPEGKISTSFAPFSSPTSGLLSARPAGMECPSRGFAPVRKMPRQQLLFRAWLWPKGCNVYDPPAHITINNDSELRAQLQWATKIHAYNNIHSFGAGRWCIRKVASASCSPSKLLHTYHICGPCGKKFLYTCRGPVMICITVGKSGLE